MARPRARQAVTEDALTPQELERIDAYWRAANYLSVGQIYLLDNPLLERPLRLEDIKPRLLGHWGTTPGLNLFYVHANRVIKNRDLHAIMGRSLDRGVVVDLLESASDRSIPVARGLPEIGNS